MTYRLDRRQLLSGAGAAALVGALDGCATPPPHSAPLQIPRLYADADRITSITVCTRPFRPQGPRLDVERIAGKTVVHNYGHGGSGWSLSWGSGVIARDNALATGEHEVAVIGCGALGLTSAVLLQRAGAQVTIYAKDLPPNVRSSLATGVWSPGSRICLEQHATPAFKRSWEEMARRSWLTYQSFLGLAGDPVEFIEHYTVRDNAPPAAAQSAIEGRPAFADGLEGELISDLEPHGKDIAPGTHPFGNRSVRHAPQMMFNLSSYIRMLMSDYLASGGKIEIAEFHSLADLAKVRQKTLVNATGYGARALFNDDSIVPVRGQLARVVSQPDIHYGVFYRGASFVPRRDGMVFQVVGENDYYGYGDDTTAPDRAEAELAIKTIASLYSQQ